MQASINGLGISAVPSIQNYLAVTGHNACSADNSQPWHLVWDDEKLSICYDKKRVGDHTFPPDHSATLLAMGAVMENVVQACQVIKVEHELIIGSSEFHAMPCYGALKILGNPLIASDILSHPLFVRHTNRFAFQRKSIPNLVQAEILSFSEGSIIVKIFDSTKDIQRIAAMVRSASEIRFQTREIHEWLGKSLRFTDTEVESGDGLDVNTLNLPPGGALFLRLVSDWRNMNRFNKFGAYRFMAYIDAAPVAKAPALLGIIAPATFKDSICAGQIMTRVWIFLNNHGIAVHPYYVISDQLRRKHEGTAPERLIAQADALEQEASSIFRLSGNDSLQILLRIGFPKHTPVKSRRLPLRRVFTDLSVC